MYVVILPWEIIDTAELNAQNAALQGALRDRALVEEKLAREMSAWQVCVGPQELIQTVHLYPNT